MDDTLGVHVQDTLHDLEGQILNVVRIHLLGVVADDIHQVLGAVLRDKIQCLKVLDVRGSHDGLKLDNVLVTFQKSQ